MLVQALRSLIFYVLFLGQTVVLAVFLGTVALFKNGWFPMGWSVARYWAASNRFFLRWITGIRSEVTGMEHIPQGGCIIAAKHQSDWDIFAILPHTDRPAFIAKKQLMNIPFFGWAARVMETISIDRAKGSGAIPAMMKDAEGAISRGCKIIIFPEGTRRRPLADPAYRSGTARLYEGLNVPIVPVALNSGLFWGRNSLILWPGTARARFLEPIPPGLPAAEMQDRLTAAIESATTELILDAVRQGLARPITPELRARIDAARTAKGPLR